jgi:CBS domain-containing membrane protein
VSWQIFKPRMAGAQAGARLLACFGAAICLVLTAVLCAQLPALAAGMPAIIAPLGASAVLVFAVPSSPLAQPWRVIGGNTISSLIGIATFQALPDATYAAGLAVGLAILIMSVLRCLHPPGGAAALLAVLAGPEIQTAGYAFAFAPVAANSVALVLLAMAFHRLTGHSYPHSRGLGAAEAAGAREAVGFRPEDFDRALTEMHETFDIAREDLELLLARVEHHARERQDLQGEPAVFPPS